MGLLQERFRDYAVPVAHVANTRSQDRSVAYEPGDLLLDDIGDLVAVIGSDAFNAPFHRLCNRLVQADHFSTYIFPRRGTPRVPIVASIEDAAAPAIAMEVNESVMRYVMHDCGSDPMLAEFRRSSKTLLREQHAGDVRSPEQRHFYFDRLNISSVVCLLGKVSDDVIYLSFYMRSEQAGIGQETADTVLRHANLLFQLSHRHEALIMLQRWRSTLSKMSAGNCADESSKDVFKEVLLSRTLLSEREAEICALSLVGYSMEAIGMICGITLNTVATHRKRGFAKLDISSVNELFAAVRDMMQDV